MRKYRIAKKFNDTFHTNYVPEIKVSFLWWSWWRNLSYGCYNEKHNAQLEIDRHRMMKEHNI